jgi:DNA-directed RNA polymerase specialized sigma24 family protein
MSDADDFLDVILRVRAGDQDAAALLVRQLEPFVLRVVRFQMRQHGNFDRLRREVGSMDVCQSVLGSLFKGFKEDRFSLASPAKLKSLLRTMIEFNLLAKARRTSVTRRTILGPDAEESLIDRGPDPEQKVIDEDRLMVFCDRLSHDELELLKRRLNGEEWNLIAADLNEEKDALRKRLKRAMERVESELNDRDDHLTPPGEREER